MEQQIEPITSIQETRDGNAFLVSTLDSTIRLFDKYSGGLLQSYKGHLNKDYRVRSCLAFVDSCVVSGSEDGEVYAWDLLDGKVVSKQPAHSGKVVTAVAVHDGRKEMLTAGVDGMGNLSYFVSLCLILELMLSFVALHYIL